MSKALRLEWDLPDSLYDTVLGDEAQPSEAAKRALVLDWLRAGRVSVRQGADLLGLEYDAFLNVLTAHRVPLCDYEDNWLDREIRTLSGK